MIRRQRLAHPRQRLVAVLAPDDQLGDHRVVVRADGVALAHAGIDADAGRAMGVIAAHELHRGWRAQEAQRAGGRQELLVGVLGVDARFQRVAVDAQLLLRERQRLAGGDAQLPFDQVLPGDHLGDRMLDLQARVHLHEIEGAVLVGDELDGAGANIAHGLRSGDCRFAHGAAAFFRHARRGRLFQHLLVPALHRAVALEQVDAVAVGIGEHLDFDMARPGQVFLHQHLVVAEAGAGLALDRRQRGLEAIARLDHAHALAAAARAGLEQHRVADAVGLAAQQRRVLVFAVVARHQRHRCALHQLLGRALAAHRVDGGGRRADEDQPRRGAGLGKGLVLGQEAVAGVDGLGAGFLRHFNDVVGAQVAVARGSAADMDRLVAEGDVAGIGVGIRIHRDGADTEPAAGGGDTAGDLAAVGDQDLAEHGSLLVMPLSASYGGEMSNGLFPMSLYRATSPPHYPA
ncbi:hypothetical protein D3C81_996990 [compost metagenome]